MVSAQWNQNTKNSTSIFFSLFFQIKFAFFQFFFFFLEKPLEFYFWFWWMICSCKCSNQMITLTPSDSFDPIRTLRMAGYGMLISGPSLHLWFNFASKLVPKRDLFSTLKKMILGQTVYGPIMTAIFFSSNAAVQGTAMHFTFLWTAPVCIHLWLVW